MRTSTYRVALSGLMTAAAVTVMFLGSFLPFSTVAVPAIASLAVLYFTMEYGKRAALAVFAAISVLSALFAPEKESVMLFIFFFGYYPLIKSLLEMMRNRRFGWALKFLLFNSAVAALYLAVTKIFIIPEVAEELKTYTPGFFALLLPLANVTFWFYDIALTRLVTLYIYRIRPKLTKTKAP